MGERLQGLAQLLPDKTSLNDCSLEELQHIARRFPFFAPAQVLLLQKMRETGAPEADAQLEKTILYFTDPLQFHYLVSPESYEMDDDSITATHHWTFPPAAHNLLTKNETAQQMQVTAEDPTTPIAEADDVEITIDGESPEPITVSSTAAAFTAVSSIPSVEPDRVTEEDLVEADQPIILRVEPLQQKQNSAATDTGPGISNMEEVPQSNEVIVAPPHELVVVEKEDPHGEQQETAVHAVQEEGAPQPGPANTNAGEEPLAFEPYHTVDYFASQGIKITADDLSKDKLSRQLRSFTDWLKIMKRLPAAEMVQTPESTAEKNVENLASHSVKGGEVVTEAMAEVWAKQGNRQKAIETYNKLSLLNPSKKAYFAAKIENLTGT